MEISIGIKILLVIWAIAAFVFLNAATALVIHVIRKTPNRQGTQPVNVMVLLIAPYMIYLIATKQGKVIDDLAMNKRESKIQKWFKGYPNNDT